MAVDHDPLLGPPTEEVPLPDAPLVRVIAQARFSSILAVQGAEHVAPFQEAIRDAYPVLSEEHAQSVVLGAQGATTGQPRVTWRFEDAEGEWRVSLAPDFVALEATKYTSRTDFLERMQIILAAVGEHIGPAVVQRIGLRYIARVTGEELGDITKLIRPEMLGIVKSPLFAHMRHAVSDVMLDVPESDGDLRARWGYLPPGGAIDMEALDPINEPCWMLDFDMFSAQQRPFASGVIIEELGRFAERLYTLFRWAVTDGFLRRYGGQP